MVILWAHGGTTLAKKSGLAHDLRVQLSGKKDPDNFSKFVRPDIRISTAPLPSQTQQYQPAGYPITDAGFDFALVDPLLLYGYSNSNPYQFPSPSIGFEHFSTGMEHPDPELMASSPYYMCNNTAFTTL